jgi:anion-transporting  ArsA/GET3 family ATPase
LNLESLFEKKMIICCGTGGVGKTTTSAALALKTGIMGKRVGLITIDPAKRLATSLGLKSLKQDPQCIDGQIRSQLSVNLKGSVSALMLDSEDTFYGFIEEVGGKNVHDVFRSSELFEVIAGNFGGAHDYLAMEKLHELYESNAFDLLILDTPPARHTLDFLDAPENIAKFFDDRIFSWFLVDARSNSIPEKLRAKGARAALGVLEKLTGEGVINDFINLAPHIYRVKNAFVERQNKIKKLITSKEAGAIFISSPMDLNRGEAKPFLEDAKQKGVEILAFIMNRSLSHLAPVKSSKELQQFSPEIRENYQNLRFLVEEEEKNFTLLKKMAGKKQILLAMPELDEDIHDLPSLHQLSQHFS